MKKMTFAVWLTALLAVFTFSSCLDDENSGQIQGGEIVKVVGMLGNYEFETASGYKLMPTNMSALTMEISTQYVYISYSYEREQLNHTTKKVPITLMGVMPIKSQFINSNTSDMDEFSNAPIRIITADASYQAFPIMFWNPTTMFLPITYFYKDSGDNTQNQNEISSHTFRVYLDLDAEESYKENMVLNVRHRVADPSLNKDRRVLNTAIYEVDLTQALHLFKQANGKEPSRIIVKYQESYGAEYVENQMTSAKTEIDYQALLNAIK